ncbi:SWIM zinc finger family protein [Paenibacillus sp. MBLB4367]|uniref:SWIM zinc finger family protein n=1 Tax=Paenibacillus sp. MBLB4367 TaxID=3384767 RepID=UPI003907FC19
MTAAAVTEAYVDSLALNAAAMKNGRDLAKKNSFPKLCRSEDETLLFGECKGSGKEPYRCSVDFVKPESPVFRCSCPSRQFPCKHILGLLYAYAGGSSFHTEDIPEDIAGKRDKAEKREEKKKEAAAASADDDAPPVAKKTNKSALTKKIAAQLEGIELLDKLLRQIVQTGLGGIDAKTARMLEEQAKQLGNHYVPGVQSAFREFLLLFQGEGEREPVYTDAVDKLTALQTLAKRGRDYLTVKKENPETPMATDTAIEERLGHAWQLSELRDSGLGLRDAKLLQLAFRSYGDDARGEYVDEGFWVELASGKVYANRNYRPYRAVKHMKEEDTFQLVAQTKELLYYPGDANPRARWEEATFREPDSQDFAAVRGYARRSYPEAVKLVKNQLKHPLADKHPVVLLHVKEIVKLDEAYALEDERGNRISLGDISRLQHPTVQLLPLLKREHFRDQVMLVMFEHDLGSGRLMAQPLTLITGQERIRLLY